VAEVEGLELRNVIAKYPFESRADFRGSSRILATSFMQWRDDTTLPSRGQSLRAIGKSQIKLRGQMPRTTGQRVTALRVARPVSSIMRWPPAPDFHLSSARASMPASPASCRPAAFPSILTVCTYSLPPGRLITTAVLARRIGPRPTGPERRIRERIGLAPSAKS
jgi:hypothetical protein